MPSRRRNLTVPVVLVPMLTSVAALVFASPGASSQPIAGRYLITASVLPAHAPVVEVLGSTGRLERVIARQNLFQAVGARWSPDGSVLAWGGPDGVAVMRADSPARRHVLVRAPVGCAQVCIPLTFAWSPDGRELLVNYDDEMPHIVGRLRAEYAKHIGDPTWEEDIRRLSERSELFAELWARHEVTGPAPRLRMFQHPEVGLLNLVNTELAVTSEADLRISVYTPDDADTKARLLLTRGGRRQASAA